MKKSFYLFFLAIFFINISHAQNVGIGTGSPTEKLDVNGNMNISGQFKVSSDSGKANQVLMKNSGNSLVWGDLSEYKNIAVLDCTNYASSVGTNNCAQGWTVPAGVTRVLVECWGGGGGGCSLTGGGGAGYLSGILTTVPGNIINFTIGAGGVYGTFSSAGINGGNTSFSYGGFNYTAFGGQGGTYGDPFVSNITTITVPTGGSFSSTSTSNVIGYSGQAGGYSVLKFIQTSTTEFAKVVEYGNGGDAAMMPNSGAKGGYRLYSATYSQTIYGLQQGVMPGGGGAADYGYGWYGKGGRVIIHY